MSDFDSDLETARSLLDTDDLDGFSQALVRYRSLALGESTRWSAVVDSRTALCVAGLEDV